MRNQLPDSVGNLLYQHTIGFIMRGSYNTALYTILLYVQHIYGEILILPFRVRHVKSARTWLPTL